MVSSAKRRHRFGAFLRLYGPKGASTHAVLVIPESHEPDAYTPEAFQRELELERKKDQLAQRYYANQGIARPRFPNYWDA